MPLTKIQSLGITDGTIVNADINASAAIAGTKISGSFGKVLQVVQKVIGDNVGLGKCYYVNGKTACRANVCSLIPKDNKYNINLVNVFGL